MATDVAEMPATLPSLSLSSTETPALEHDAETSADFDAAPEVATPYSNEEQLSPREPVDAVNEEELPREEHAEPNEEPLRSNDSKEGTPAEEAGSTGSSPSKPGRKTSQAAFRKQMAEMETETERILREAAVSLPMRPVQKRTFASVASMFGLTKTNSPAAPRAAAAAPAAPKPVPRDLPALNLTKSSFVTLEDDDKTAISRMLATPATQRPFPAMPGMFTKAGFTMTPAVASRPLPAAPLSAAEDEDDDEDEDEDEDGEVTRRRVARVVADEDEEEEEEEKDAPPAVPPQEEEEEEEIPTQIAPKSWGAASQSADLFAPSQGSQAPAMFSLGSLPETTLQADTEAPAAEEPTLPLVDAPSADIPLTLELYSEEQPAAAVAETPAPTVSAPTISSVAATSTEEAAPATTSTEESAMLPPVARPARPFTTYARRMAKRMIEDIELHSATLKKKVKNSLLEAEADEEDDEGDLVARGPDDEEGNDEMTEEDRNFIDAGEVEDTRAERVEAIFRREMLEKEQAEVDALKKSIETGSLSTMRRRANDAFGDDLFSTSLPLSDNGESSNVKRRREFSVPEGTPVDFSTFVRDSTQESIVLELNEDHSGELTDSMTRRSLIRKFSMESSLSRSQSFLDDQESQDIFDRISDRSQHGNSMPLPSPSAAAPGVPLKRSDSGAGRFTSFIKSENNRINRLASILMPDTASSGGSQSKAIKRGGFVFAVQNNNRTEDDSNSRHAR